MISSTFPTLKPERPDLQDGRSRNLVMGMAGALLLCMWLAAELWLWSSRINALETNSRVLDELSVVVLEQTQGLFKQAETTLAVTKQWISDHPQQDPAVSPHFIALVELMRKTSNGMLDLRLVTRDGFLRYVPDQGQTNYTSVTDRDYFRAQFNMKTRGLFIAAPVKSRVTNKWGIPISMPVDVGGGNIAVLFVAIELDRMEHIFESARIKPHGTIALFRSDGLTMFRAPFDEQQLGRSIQESESWRLHMAPGLQGSYESAVSPIDGVQRLVSYGHLAEYPLVVAVTASKSDLLAAWSVNAIALLLGMTALTLGFLFLSRMLVRALDAESEMRRELQSLMLTDALTGTGNRRMLMLRLEEEVKRATRYGRPMSLVFIDVDHFKKVNDDRGHAVGDKVLIQVARCIARNLRQSDHFGRYGGEEFVIVLVETALTDAHRLVERIRKEVGSLEIEELGRAITISCGIAQIRQDESMDNLIQRGDAALYRAKGAGRNRTCVDFDTESFTPPQDTEGD